jgi:hypothetical protein
MAKLIILSVLLMSVALPTRFSTAPNPRKALRKTQLLVGLFVVVWGFLCLNWYPVLVPMK